MRPAGSLSFAFSVDNTIYPAAAVDATLAAYEHAITVDRVERDGKWTTIAGHSVIDPSVVEGEFRNYLIHACVASHTGS